MPEFSEAPVSKFLKSLRFLTGHSPGQFSRRNNVVLRFRTDANRARSLAEGSERFTRTRRTHFSANTYSPTAPIQHFRAGPRAVPIVRNTPRNDANFFSYFQENSRAKLKIHASMFPRNSFVHPAGNYSPKET